MANPTPVNMKKILLAPLLCLGVLDACADGPPTNRWAGLSGGLHGGYGWGQARNTMSGAVTGAHPSYTDTDTLAAAMANAVPSHVDNAPDGYVGGLGLGYNWQHAALVYGLEAGLWGGNIRQTGSTSGRQPVGNANSVSSAIDLENKIDRMLLLRARLGYAHGNWLLYGSAGIVSAELRSRLSASETIHGLTAGITTALPGSTAGRSEQLGWTAGCGLEYALSEKWSLRGDYQYYDLGRTKVQARFASYLTGSGEVFASSMTEVTTKWTGNLVTMGLNYRF